MFTKVRIAAAKLSRLAAVAFALTVPSFATVITYGDEDCLNSGCYGASNPLLGATLQGLAANTVTLATTSFGHGYPFSPSSDYPGTDQIFVGSNQTGSDDGYSVASQRIAGPSTITLDYSAAVPGGSTVASLTLGIAADDFQFPSFGNPFTARINGTTNAALTAQLNALSQSGPQVQFFTLGLDASAIQGNHILTLSIDEGGNGGDGYAIDFLTLGVVTATTGPVPAPESQPQYMIVAGVLLILVSRRRWRAGR